MSAIDYALAPFAPAPRRYPIVQLPHGVTGYGPWRIHFDPPPIPVRTCDWHWSHDDFDGAEDAGDSRAGSASSLPAALNECDAWEDEQVSA